MIQSAHGLALLAAVRKEIERYDAALRDGEDIYSLTLTVKFDLRGASAAGAVVRGTDLAIERVRSNRPKV